MRNCLVQIVMAVVIGILAVSCGAINATPINEINTSPANFDGKEVTLQGVAKGLTRIPLFNTKAYVLKDDSGEITILTEADLPRMNEKITVKVKVANIAIINGESLGMTVTEISRR
ncbi:hypothetical protein EBAPG3_002455 [Nitrosospira lacus]|uniref:Bacterial OB-fold domain-containing protein n=1 Tax=Nitrosospira lacus TaxID=1288494 RepID=A0A1W6SLQ3_9PROT|nr:hypothetical protein [Nitrosospira lacus]ARO86723.1 hypothetical protein EBAPG3_002455 [Nitrosospira lacus]